MNLNLGDTRLIIDECVREELSLPQAAYVLATAFWETARTMEPVKEAFWLDEEYRRENLRYYPFYGRGYVQLTWRTNYKRAGDVFGVDLVQSPDKALDPEIAVKTLVTGSKEGWFTGKKLSDYINENRSDWKSARWIINGTDRASEIADIAGRYAELLRLEGYGIKPDFMSAMLALIQSILKALGITK